MFIIIFLIKMFTKYLPNWNFDLLMRSSFYIMLFMKPYKISNPKVTEVFSADNSI